MADKLYAKREKLLTACIEKLHMHNFLLNIFNILVEKLFVICSNIISCLKQQPN